MNIIFQLL